MIKISRGAVILLGVMFMISCSSRYQGPVSDHFDGKKFFNPNTVNGHKSFWALLRWKFSGKASKWPSWVELSNNTAWEPLKEGDLRERLTHINHATTLLEFQGLKIITDPIFSQRASPVKWAGPKRIKPPGLQLEDLPPIDVVLISHNHYDHLDLESLRLLKEKDDPIFYTALGDCKILSQIKGIRCQELDWWQTVDLKSEVKVTFAPSQHWSARGFFDRNRSLWGAYIVEVQGKKVYFAGDTGYGDHFKEAAKRFGGFDLALLPIGAYEPRWFMKEAHMNPEEAVKAHLDLKATKSLGVHWGTFQLTDEYYLEPLELLKEALKSQGVSEKNFFTLENGDWVWLELMDE